MPFMEYYLAKECTNLCEDWSKRRLLTLDDVSNKLKRLRTGEFLPVRSEESKLLAVLHVPLEAETSEPVQLIEKGHDALNAMRFELSGETKWFSAIDFGKKSLSLLYVDEYLSWEGIGSIFSVASRLPVEPRIALLMVLSLRFKTSGLLFMRHFGILQSDLQMCMCGRGNECECGVSDCDRTHLFSEEELQESGAPFVGSAIPRDDAYLDNAQRHTAMVCQRIMHPSYNEYIYNGTHKFHQLIPRHDQTREHLAITLEESRGAFLDGTVYLTAEMRFGKTRIAGALIKSLCSEARGAGCDCVGTKRLASESIASDQFATHCIIASYQKALVAKWNTEVSEAVSDTSKCKFIKHNDLCTEMARLSRIAKSVLIIIDEWHMISKTTARALGDMLREFMDTHGSGSLNVVLVSASPLAKGLESSRVHLSLVGKGPFCETSFLESSQNQHTIVNLSVAEVITHCSNTFLESVDTCQLPGLYLHKRERWSNIKCFSRQSTTQGFNELFSLGEDGKTQLQLEYVLFKLWPRVIPDEEINGVIKRLHNIYPGTLENGYSTSEVLSEAKFLLCQPVPETNAIHQNLMDFEKVIRKARSAAFGSMVNRGFSYRVAKSFRELCIGMEKMVTKLQSRLARASSIRELEHVRVASERMLEAFKMKYERFINGDGQELLRAINKAADCSLKPLTKAPIFPGDSGSGEEYHCPVCFDAEVTTILPCHHALCTDCYKMISGVCPSCRSPMFPHSVQAGAHSIPVLIDLAAWKVCVSNHSGSDVVQKYNEIISTGAKQSKAVARPRFSFTPSISEQDVFLERAYKELIAFLRANITKRVVIFANRAVANDMRRLFPVCSSAGGEMRLVNSLDTFNNSPEKNLVFTTTWFLSTAVTITADIIVFMQPPSNAGTCKQALARTKIRNDPNRVPQLIVLCVDNQSWREGYHNICGISCPDRCNAMVVKSW